jgi:pantetheine-phosphate adenylyltransferase
VTSVLFPGTFDPPTLGHLDLVTRAARLCGSVVVGLADHATKQALFPAAERLELLRAVTAQLDGVRVVRVTGLVVDACRENGCQAVLRGLRGVGDLDYERHMAATNRALAPGIDTVLLFSSPTVAHVSSTLVRQIA